ncbi:flagellar protein FlbD [Petrotoga sp. 9PW.55.5.1]|jgi:flagellar protein FlbD|uniref:flagellar FlbD family protein n=1 Tax=Petrotoga sp. 9PW.55.5.1 TaxID=1308979 RepID=UPI000DC235A0|nr:flagellar FlbD family protein [Petrotoga sp. 9PW.55.5.1]RAP00033.1 flagellar protein FlbD [Petrotoga sp. 9PW.55.5.1]
MIKLTKLNDDEFYINPYQIEKIECHPDTTITMMNGHVYVVKEKIEDLIQKVIEFNRKIFSTSN